MNKEIEMREVLKALSFFRSAINSGESWTEDCQYVYDNAAAVVEQAIAVLEAQEPVASELIHVGFTNPHQIKYAKDESGSFYPDTEHECHIPLYMMQRHENRLSHDYTVPPTPATGERVCVDPAPFNQKRNRSSGIPMLVNFYSPCTCGEYHAVRSGQTVNYKATQKAGATVYVEGTGQTICKNCGCHPPPYLRKSK